MTDLPNPVPSDPEVLASAWLRHHRAQDDSDFWAWQVVHDTVRADSESGWQILLAALRQASSEDLEFIGAGILEYLCRFHGAAVIERVELHAATDPRFKTTLGTIWLTTPEVPQGIVDRCVAASGGKIAVLDHDFSTDDDTDGA